jgi:hypothetical protein
MELYVTWSTLLAQCYTFIIVVHTLLCNTLLSYTIVSFFYYYYYYYYY